MRFDRPLGVGADGGHGPVRYRVPVEPGADATTVTVSTGAALRSRAGRVYLSAIAGPVTVVR